MIIRDYNSNDNMELIKLFNECFDKDYKCICMSPSSKIFVMEFNNKIIGMASIDILNDIFKNIKYGYVNNVCVSKECQGKGFGKELMSKIDEYAKEMNLEYIILTSNKKRIAAHKLYKKCGYEIVDTCFFKKKLFK